MTTVSKLVRQINEALLDGRNAPLESLAAEYARLCQEANQRLESCAAMIEKGSDYQALQLAETEPQLLDLIGALSFAEAPQWVALCEKNHLSTPPKFDARAVQVLDRLYAQGIGANHPLYKDYRAAVTARDDTKALQIVRSIVRLNPADANAKAELARIENKMFQLRLGQLRAALAQNNENAVLADLDEMERLATAAVLEKTPEYARACDLRRVVRRREAMMTAERLVDSLEAERQADAWRMVGDILSRVRALQAEHGFTLSEAANAKYAEMQRYYDTQRLASEEAARYEQAITNLGALTESFDNAVITRASLTLARVRKVQGEFSLRWKEIEQFQRPVPEAFLQRVRTTAATLHGELERLERARRVKIVITSVAVVAVLAVTSWFTITAVRAQDYATQLGHLRDAGQVDAVEKMAVDVRTNHALLAGRPGLASRLDEVEHWAQEERHKLADIQSHLDELEKTAKAGMNDTDPFDFGTKLDSTEQLIAALAEDLRAAPASRALVVRNQFDAHVVALREKFAAEEDTQLGELETTAGEQLGFDQKKETLAAAVAAIDPKLKKLEARVKPPVAALEMPKALQVRLVALRKRVDLFRQELDTLAQANESLFQANSLKSYLDALARYKGSRLTQSPDVNAARKLLAGLPQVDDLFEGMLMPGDTVGWAAAKTDVTNVLMAPDTVMPTEIGSLVRLHDDQYLNDIWQVSFTDFRQKKKQRDLYSRGEPAREGPRLVGDSQSTTWSCALYDPARKTTIPLFIPTTISVSRSSTGVTGDGEITTSHLSSGSACLARLELNRMTDPAGSKYERPLLRVFDDLVQDKAADPLFKAYLMQQLGTVLKVRPYSWGLEYCASLRGDLSELDGLCENTSLRSEDWLTEHKRQELGAKLHTFFDKLHQRRYFLEAQLQREVIRGVLKAGLQFGGFIDGANQPHLLGEARNTKVLWVFAQEQQKLVRYVAGDAPADAGKDSTAKAEPFSPVFFVPLDRDALRQTVERWVTSLSGENLKLPSNPWLELP